MTKLPYPTPGPILEKEVSRPTCKVTFPLLLLWGGLAVVYFSGSGDLFPLLFPELEKYQLWRLTLSFLASLNGLELILNLGAAGLLTYISERVNGSGYYAVDLVLKNFLINLLTLLAFIVLLCCSIVLDSPFDGFLQRQTDNPSRGLLPLLTFEIAYLLLNFRSDGDEWLKSNFSRFSVTLLTLLLVPIIFTNYDALWLHSSLGLALLFKLRFIDYSPLLEGIGCFRVSGQRTYSKLIYPNIGEGVASDFYESSDNSAVENRGAPAGSGPTNAPTDAPVDEEAPQDKSRFETVNVDDYKLASLPGVDGHQDQESFEI